MGTEFHRVGRCRYCGRLTNVSARRICRECAKRRIEKAIQQLKRGRGRLYQAWRAAYLQALADGRVGRPRKRP
jgi:hypothetical protein